MKKVQKSNPFPSNTALFIYNLEREMSCLVTILFTFSDQASRRHGTNPEKKEGSPSQKKISCWDLEAPLLGGLLGQKSSSVVKFCRSFELVAPPVAGDPLAVLGGVWLEPALARLPFLPLVDNWGDSAQHWMPMSLTRTILRAPSSSRWRLPFVH